MSKRPGPDTIEIDLSFLDPPDPTLDPFLDAAARCFQRYGLRRTTVPDIADELGVSRSTVYRRVGSVEELARKLFVRELRVALRDTGPISIRGPEAVVRLVAKIARIAARHGVLRKLVRDEPELVGRFMVVQYSRVLAVAVPLLAAPLGRAMRAGRVARRNPDAVAEWVIRMTISLILAPPRGDPEILLRETLLPVLDPREAPSR